MAFKGNTGEVHVAKQTILYTGVDLFKVVAINPSMIQLIGLGFDPMKEPEYLGVDKNDDSYTRIDIWLQGTKHERPIKFTTFLGNTHRINKDGDKCEYINGYGVTAWGSEDSLPDAKWFKHHRPRKAYRGEAQLMTFIRAWLNVGKEDEVFIEDWENIFRGNVKELQDLVTQFADNKVNCMLVVRESADGKNYQDVYPNFFRPWDITDLGGWRKHLAKNPPRNVVFSYELKEYKPSEPTPDTDAETTAEVNDWT